MSVSLVCHAKGKAPQRKGALVHAALGKGYGRAHEGTLEVGYGAVLSMQPPVDGHFLW
jgi:hypothetical protein